MTTKVLKPNLPPFCPLLTEPPRRTGNEQRMKSVLTFQLVFVLWPLQMKNNNTKNKWNTETVVICIATCNDGLIRVLMWSDLSVGFKCYLNIANVGQMFWRNCPRSSLVCPLVPVFKGKEDPAVDMIIVLILTFLQGFPVLNVDRFTLSLERFVQ